MTSSPRVVTPKPLRVRTRSSRTSCQIRARQQPAAVLTGFLGDSDESGRSRLYLTPQFDQYVEFDAEDALHSQPLTTDESGLGGSAVWLKAGARVRLARTVSHEVQAEFLQGGITAGFMPSAAFSGMPMGQRQPDMHAPATTSARPTHTSQRARCSRTSADLRSAVQHRRALPPPGLSSAESGQPIPCWRRMPSALTFLNAG